jgi:hypothetical protein
MSNKFKEWWANMSGGRWQLQFEEDAWSAAQKAMLDEVIEIIGSVGGLYSETLVHVLKQKYGVK